LVCEQATAPVAVLAVLAKEHFRESMAEVYRVTRTDGSVEFTDAPTAGDNFERLRQARPARDAGRENKPYDHKRVEQMIRDAQKYIPKIPDYIEYLDYLRHRSPVRFDQVMKELRREDPQAWLKLQKFPQFRPLREAALGLKAGSNLIEVSVQLAAGKFTGSAEKWMESTVKSMMQRDRWGLYADVLGSKATTLPSKVTSYSASRLGQYLQANSANLEAAGKAAAKELALSQAGVRAAAGGAFARLGNSVLGVVSAPLDPQLAPLTANALVRRRIDLLSQRNPAFDKDTADLELALRLLNLGKFEELDALLKRYE
jgi:hypothetical protein